MNGSVFCRIWRIFTSTNACVACNRTLASLTTNHASKFGESNKFQRKTANFEKQDHYKPKLLKWTDAEIDENEVLRTIKSKNDADIFGSFTRERTTELPLVDEGDVAEEKHAQAILKRDEQPPLSFYAKEIKNFLKDRNLREALQVLEVRMIQEDGVQPDDYLYNLLIGECGRVGYTKKAFELYRRMKDRQLKVSGSTITGLFNSCANSPWNKNGLTNANYLRNDIKVKGIGLNDTNYHAMIKAFGKCGDLKTAFEIVDEMAESKIPLSQHTFSNLLVACISNKEAGLLHAILIFRTMRQKKVIPGVFAYNLLLRAVHDCGIGAAAVAEKLLLTPEKQFLAGSKKKQESVTSLLSDQGVSAAIASSINNKTSEMVVAQKPSASIPDLLNPYFDQGSIVALTSLTTPSRRLALLGGVNGILSRMQRDRAKPDLKTFTQLLQIVNSNRTAESELLFAMEKHGVNPDITFFNMLIKKRNFRGCFKEATNVLTLVSRNKLYPDMMTFGCLALGCRNWEDGKRLISDMRNAGFRPNVEIVGSLVKNACFTRDFWYLIDMLKLMKEENIQPSPKLLENVEKCRMQMREEIVKQEKEGHIYKSSSGFATFMKYYKQWLSYMKVDLPGHPWDAYASENVDAADQSSTMESETDADLR